MFTTGRIVFIVVFVIAFVFMLAWGYRKERQVIRTHFPKPWKVILALILFVGILFMIVKIRKFL